ncbi:uncharacterized protein [Musca autumnalis]|uniref:uncharacterized protein n=1 Tax=Musca autumnalis TaxID=221902 RepID=UPI003CE8C2CA
MLAYIVTPVIQFMHLLHKISVFILSTGYHTGRTIFLILLKICHFIRDLFAALIVIGEELYNFLCELNASVSAVSHYVRTSANGGVSSVIDAGLIFCRHLSKFFSNTRIHSKLLATKLGSFVCDFFELLRNALLLIADCVWWLITLVPRILLYLLIAVGDAIVAIITTIRKAIVYSVTVVIEDIFRITIAVTVLIVVWHNKRRLALFVIRSIRYLKDILVLFYRRLILLYNRLFRRQRRNPSLNGQPQNSTPTRSRLPRQSVSPATSEKSIDTHQRCVVCRDRPKCVLLLPCKHLCLCDECADYILFSGQRQTCPLCRTNIVHSMSVYT